MGKKFLSSRWQFSLWFLKNQQIGPMVEFTWAGSDGSLVYIFQYTICIAYKTLMYNFYVSDVWLVGNRCKHVQEYFDGFISIWNQKPLSFKHIQYSDVRILGTIKPVKHRHNIWFEAGENWGYTLLQPYDFIV